MKKFSMKAKTISRIADQIAKSKSGYNAEGGTYQPTPKDFARLTWFLEKILLPHHIEQYTQSDLEKYITKYLEQKGHLIEQEHDPEIDATQNPEIYTIHSTKEEKKKEKAATAQLLAGQMECPNCGEANLEQAKDQPNPEYPQLFQCPECLHSFNRKDLVAQDKETDQNLSSVFNPL
jgi:hypothetical protein